MGKIVRVGTDHPAVCQGNAGGQPCEYRRLEGSQFCPMHGGSTQEYHTQRKELRNYKLNTAFGDRVKEMSLGSVKNLQDEITMLRVALEAIFNRIENANEMLLYSDKIEKLVKQIASTTHTWQQIQERNKELMDRETVLSIFDELMEVIVSHVDDPDKLECLAKDGHAIIAKRLSG